MSLLARLLGKAGQDRSQLIPLWNRIVAIAREPQWYAKGGIADTIPGRFDAVTLVLCLVLLRMERDAELKQPMARLTELFVEDMDGQLRQNGIGDMVVGKHIGRLVSTLGGRLGAYRKALAQPEIQTLEAAVVRNVTTVDGASPVALTAEIRHIAQQLDALDATRLLAGDIKR